MNTRMTREETALERRRLLVNVAAECFAEKGFHQTSMRDLAERAGVSLGNLYNHFDSKTALIAEIAKLEAEELQYVQAELDEIDDPVAALDHFVVVYAKSCAETYNARLTAEIMSEGLRNPAICADFLKNRKVVVATLTSILRQISETRDLKTDVQPERSAEFVLDLVEGSAMRFAFEGRAPRKKGLATLRTAVHQLAGLRS